MSPSSWGLQQARWRQPPLHRPRNPGAVFGLPLVAVVVLILGGVLTGGLFAAPSATPEQNSWHDFALYFGSLNSHPWSLVTSVLLAGSPLEYLLSTPLLFTALAFACRFVGPLRAGLTFLVGGALSALGLSLVLDWGVVNDNQWLGYLGGTYQMGCYGGVCAALGFTTAAFGSLWRRRLRLWLLALTVMLVLYLGQGATILAFFGAVLGVLSGMAVYHRRQTTSGTHPSSPLGLGLAHTTLRETRVLVATVVAVSALGLWLTQLTANFASGPLFMANQLALQGTLDAQTLRDVCNGSESCVNLQSWIGINSPGAVVFTLIPVLLLLVCADGLRRGRRLSWWITVAAQSYMALNALLAVVVFYSDPQVMFDAEISGFVAVYLLPTVLSPLGIVLLLLIRRNAFEVRASTVSGRSLARLSIVLLASLLVVYIVAWFSEDNQTTSSLLDLLVQLPHLLIPFQLPFDTYLPQGPVSTALYGFGGAVVWLLLLVQLVRHSRRYRGHGRERTAERDKAEALIRRGGGALSQMALWEGNHYWFTADGRAGVAYQVHHGVAITVAEPFGVAAAQAEAALGFTRYAVEAGIVPCFYSAPAELGTELAPMGFRPLEVAEETRLEVASQTFKGKDWQNVRTAINRARKLDVEVVWGTYASFGPLIRAQLVQLSEEWADEQPLPPLGFTLGGLDELRDDGVLCALAVDVQGEVLAATSWLPVYREGQIVSWTLDFMRRRSTAFNGVMDFLIASAVTRFQNDVQEISLSGSPLAGQFSAAEGPSDAMDRLLSTLAKALEPYYGFRSLAAFKARFKPVHRTLYMYYQDPLSLPSVALALTEAYLPGMSMRQRTSLLRTLVTGPEAEAGTGSGPE